MRVKATALFFAFIFIIPTARSQSWLEAMQTGRYADAKKSFEEFWDGRSIEKGKGYKQFKRWEWFWQNRIDADGKLPPASFTLNAFNEYTRSHGKENNRIGNWTSLGPVFSPGGYAGIGRVNCVAFDPLNVNIIYVGTSGGGFWKTMDGGVTWTTTSDALGTLGVSSIVVNPNNTQELYLATGDADGGDNYSIGVLKSTNGGNTFQTTGLNWATSDGRQISKLVMSPTNTQQLLAATSIGIYRTTNGGNTWTQVNASTNFRDMELKPSPGAQTYYACRSNTIFRSDDNGVTWTSMQTISGVNRIALGVSPADSNYIYALCSSSANNGFLGLYRSVNGGGSASFTLQSNSPNIMGWNQNGSDTGGQGSYDLVIAVDPNDKNIVHVGGVNHWKSTDGGVTWLIKSIWSSNNSVPEVHADKHALEWQGNTLFEGNDGGLYSTGNGGNSWQYRSVGIVNSQMYKVGISEMDDKVITGLQDNGSKMLNGNTWYDVNGGDGMECGVQKNDANVLYSSVYYGAFARSVDGGATWAEINATLPNGNWVTPFIIDPQLPTTIYAGFSSLYRSTNQGENWGALGSVGSSPNFLAVAPSNTSVMYTGTANGSLRKSINGGTSWTVITNPGSGKTDLVVDPKDPNHIFLTRSNYSSGTKVYESTNAGSSWTDISGSLPSIPANCIVYQEGTNDGIYIGMDIGIYYKDDQLTDWVLFNTGLPNVVITDLDIDYDEGKLYAATYGRGLWSSDLYSPIACKKPKGLQVSDVTNIAAKLTWTSPATPPALYQTQWSATQGTLPLTGDNTTDLFHDFSGLAPTTSYYFYVRSVCGADTSSWSIFGPVKTEDICPKPQTIITSNIRANGATFTWNTIGIPVNGLEYAVTSSASPPANGTTITTNNITVTGLTSNTSYYFHLRSNCGLDGFSTWVTKSFITSYSCGQSVYDSGGSSANYSDGENITRNICPANDGEVVTLTFTDFGVEEGWDALYIHDGDDTSAPLFSSGNPPTDANFPAGGYYGFTNPGSFTSNNYTGCLTTRFLSDGAVTELGWVADVSCTNVCTSIVTNTDNDGPGSLRFVSFCNPSATIITFSSALINDTIALTQPLVLSKNVTLNNNTGGNIYIASSGSSPLIKVNSGTEIFINNLKLISSANGENKALLNEGSCILSGVDIINNPTASPGSLIKNKGLLSIDGNVMIKN